MIILDWLIWLGSVVGSVVTCITFLGVLWKPIRARLRKTIVEDVGGEYGDFIEGFKTIQQILLKNEITLLYYQYLDKDKPNHSRELMAALYTGYKSLGGNSYVDLIYKEFMEN